MFKFLRRVRMKPSDQDRLKQLEFDFSELRTDFERLNTQHQTLSGRYYARFGKGEPLPHRVESEKETKADVLRRIGYVPGRPAPHNQ